MLFFRILGPSIIYFWSPEGLAIPVHCGNLRGFSKCFQTKGWGPFLGLLAGIQWIHSRTMGQWIAKSLPWQKSDFWENTEVPFCSGKNKMAANRTGQNRNRRGSAVRARLRRAVWLLWTLPPPEDGWEFLLFAVCFCLFLSFAEHGLPGSNTGARSIGVPGWPRRNAPNWIWILNLLAIQLNRSISEDNYIFHKTCFRLCGPDKKSKEKDWEKAEL